MAVTVTLTKVQTAEDGRLYVDFSDGSQLEFQDKATMKALVGSTDLDPSVLQLYLINWWLKRNPDADNVQLLEGMRATFDLGASVVFKVE